MSKKKAQYYVVWVGRNPGIYDSWEVCEAEVKGVAAKYKGFPSLAEAESAFSRPWEEFISRKEATPVEDSASSSLFPSPSSPSPSPSPSFPSPSSPSVVTSPVYPALAVDAACSGNPGLMEFRGVIADTGTEVFHRGPYKCGTNNIGEFLAIILGLAYLKQHNLPWVLYSDSKTAQSWIRQKQCKSKLEENSANTEIFRMIRAGEKWLHDNTWTTRILKWDTEHWGEIPADFGRK